MGSIVWLRLVQNRLRILPSRISNRLGRLQLLIGFRLRTEVTPFIELLVDGLLEMILGILGLAFKIFAKIVAMIARSRSSNFRPCGGGMLQRRNFIFLVFIFRNLGQSGRRSQSKKLSLLLLLDMLGQLLAYELRW